MYLYCIPTLIQVAAMADATERLTAETAKFETIHKDFSNRSKGPKTPKGGKTK